MTHRFVGKSPIVLTWRLLDGVPTPWIAKPTQPGRLHQFEITLALLSVPSKFGDIDFVECVGDDVLHGELTSFPRAVQAKDDEVVVFSWIIYPSKETRDAANKKIMADERLKKMMENPPFDGKRMIFGGFKPFLGLN